MRSRGPKNSQGKVSVNSQVFGTRGQVRSPASRLGDTVRGDLSKPPQTENSSMGSDPTAVTAPSMTFEPVN